MSVGDKLKEKDLCGPLEVEKGNRKGSSSRCSVSELEMRLEDCIGKRGGRDKDLQLGCLLPQTEWPLGSQGILLELWPGIKQHMDGEKFGREDVHDLLELGQVGSNRLSASELGMGM